MTHTFALSCSLGQLLSYLTCVLLVIIDTRYVAHDNILFITLQVSKDVHNSTQGSIWTANKNYRTCMSDCWATNASWRQNYCDATARASCEQREILELMRFIGCPEPPLMGSWRFVPPETSQAAGVPCATLQGEHLSFTWGRNVRKFRFSPLALPNTSCEDWQMSVRASRAAPTPANWSCEVWPLWSEPWVRCGSTKGSTLSMPADKFTLSG